MMAISFVVALLATGATAGVDKVFLPEVDTVLNKATNKANVFAKQAQEMQQQLHEKQMKAREALAEQKGLYEQRLFNIGNYSHNVSVKNHELQAGIRHLTTANDALTAKLEAYRGENARMYASLKSITEKVSLAQQFLEDSMKVTDDSEAAELEVLATTTAKPTLHNFLKATTDGKVSLLAVSRGDEPEEIVGVLAQSLADIERAELEGAAELKAHFQANYDAAGTRLASLKATQVELREQTAELKEHREKLLTAEEYLKSVRVQLRTRLDSLHVFADRIDDSAATTLGVKAPKAEVVAAAPAPANNTNATNASLVRPSKAEAATNTSNATTPKTPAAKSNASVKASAHSVAAGNKTLAPPQQSKARNVTKAAAVAAVKPRAAANASVAKPVSATRASVQKLNATRAGPKAGKLAAHVVPKRTAMPVAKAAALAAVKHAAAATNRTAPVAAKRAAPAGANGTASSELVKNAAPGVVKRVPVLAKSPAVAAKSAVPQEAPMKTSALRSQQHNAADVNQAKDTTSPTGNRSPLAALSSWFAGLREDFMG